MTTRDAARYQMARYERCKVAGIKPVQADDRTLCANDQIEVFGRPLRHDPEYVELLRATAR